MHLQIAIIVSFFGLCVTMPLFARYFAYSHMPTYWKILGFVLCLLVVVLPIFVSRNWADTYGKYFAVIEYTLYFIYTFAIILFSFTLIRDVFWVVGHLVKLLPNPLNPSLFDRVNLVTVLGTILCTFWALYQGIKIPEERHLTLSSPKITQEKTIVVLSDLHISRTVAPSKIKAIVDKTNAIKPDLIVLAGDIIDDDPKAIHKTTQLLAKLQAPQGIYFVSGNHEFYIGYQAAMEALAVLGFTPIDNQHVQLDSDFYVVGTPDIRTTERFHTPSKLAENFENIPNSAYTLFVSHSPTPLNLPFDLQVSGHTHGGQIFPFHFFSWIGNHRLLAGLYPKERIYISRGAGQWGPQMRFLAPSEISVIHLKKN